jgi:hypothetical protein
MKARVLGNPETTIAIHFTRQIESSVINSPSSPEDH